MTKIEEIIDNNFKGCYSHYLLVEENVKDAMKEYAEWYAKKCLGIAAEEAVTFLPFHTHLHGTKNIDKDSILNIKLPDHEESNVK